MFGINGSADGFRQQIHLSIDLNQQVHSDSESELNSSASNDLSEVQCSLESMLTKALDGEQSPKLENPVQISIKNEEDASVGMPLHLLPPTVLKSESKDWTYPAAASLPAPPPPSPASLFSMEFPPSLDLSEIDSVDSRPSLVLMGCTYCHIHVLVSEAAPKCPKCRTDDLLNQFRGNSGMWKRKNN